METIKHNLYSITDVDTKRYQKYLLKGKRNKTVWRILMVHISNKHRCIFSNQFKIYYFMTISISNIYIFLAPKASEFKILKLIFQKCVDALTIYTLKCK